MQSLPPLVTAGGTFRLPLSEGTAARLAAAWLCEPGEARRAQLRSALAEDPALALWAALQIDSLEPATRPRLDDLAAWLGGTLWAQFAERFTAVSGEQEAPSSNTSRDSSCDHCAEAAGHSLVVAHLARLLAQGGRLDGEAAYLLGLLHQAPRWLKATATVPVTGGGPILPAWLSSNLGPVGHVQGHRAATLADCVGQAAALANSQDEALFAQRGIDPRPWIGQASRWAKAWSAPGPWAEALPRLAERLARLAQLEADFARTLEVEKLESLKELAYGAGHEINNPLANISARAQTLLPGESDPDRRRLLAAINTQAFRAHEMIADMMLFARPPAPQLAEVEVNGLLEKIVAELAGQATAQQTAIVFTAAGTKHCMRGDATQLAVAIRAVCVNALEALVSGGSVKIALHESSESRATTQIDIADSGPGIPENVRRHLFDPFYSGREAGRGLGFGLSKCWRIVTMHEGRIEVSKRPEGGTLFCIALPNSNNR